MKEKNTSYTGKLSYLNTVIFNIITFALGIQNGDQEDLFAQNACTVNKK